MRAAYLAPVLVLLAALFYARPASAADKGSSVRGIRNNNPFNLRPSSQYTWQGEAGVDAGPAGPYLIFSTPFYGLRAGYINLLNQQKLHGLDTVRAVISKYAPAADRNDTDAYIAAVAGALGVAPDARIDLTDPATLDAFARAVIQHENGAQPYSADQLAAAARAAVA